MTTPDAQSVLVAVARLEERYNAMIQQLERMDRNRDSSRNEIQRQLAIVQEQTTTHQKKRDGEIAQIKDDQRALLSDIAEIREALAGGTATRRFIITSVGVAAGVATVLGIFASLVPHIH